MRLYWFEFYEQTEDIKKVGTVPTLEVEDLPLRGMLEVKRAPISNEKKVEIVAQDSAHCADCSAELSKEWKKKQKKAKNP